ncbi:MAG TPA: hypothetical protein VHG08_27400 [Longimicrobium sp.]|nr:hypothetical protein [Longimicrobium sp.]
MALPWSSGTSQRSSAPVADLEEAMTFTGGSGGGSSREAGTAGGEAAAEVTSSGRVPAAPAAAGSQRLASSAIPR